MAAIVPMVANAMADSPGSSAIIEVKYTEKVHPIHEVQLLTYLRLTGKKLGLMSNFGQDCLKTGIKRVVNRL